MPQFVIAYDISSDSRRERAARVLLGVGYRIQKSVFMAQLDSDQLKELKRELGAILRSTDQLEFFPIDMRSPSHLIAWSHQPHTLEPVVVVG